MMRNIRIMYISYDLSLIIGRRAVVFHPLPITTPLINYGRHRHQLVRNHEYRARGYSVVPDTVADPETLVGGCFL